MKDSVHRFSLPAWLALAALVLVMLLPWWRHREYLRDLFDYGLVIRASARMELGEKPYVDFTTPIQAGFLGLNWLVERAGDGTYGALTRGGALLIAASTLGLSLVLARRWPWWAALLVGGAVTAASAAQHTILWHNALGVFALALATWAAACAPVWERKNRPWNVLTAAGLLLGGLNKLNFHLVAVAVCLAWAVRAGLLRQARVGRAILSGGAIVGVGLLLPVLMELAWTGASPRLWFANVVQLAGGSRAGLLWAVWSPDFLLKPPHDYYGPQLLPQLGLFGLLLSAGALAGCWPAADHPDRAWSRVLAPLAVVLATAAAAALLATNFEIGCLGLAAWLALMVSLWLGFGTPARRGRFVGGLLVPAVILGAVGWLSAWQGQRSQFGFSEAPRSAYQPVEDAGPAFARLHPLKLPPDLLLSLELMDRSMPDPDASGLRPVFYGAGLEFMDRIHPARWRKGQPLWAHFGTTYGLAEIAALGEELARGEPFQAVFLTEAFDRWPDPLQRVLDRHYNKDLVGPRVRRWSFRDQDAVNFADFRETLGQLGGNVHGRLWHLDRRPFKVRQLPDGRKVFGTAQREGNVLLRVPVYRLRGAAVLARLPAAGDGPLTAEFKVIVHGGIPENVRWLQQVELPAGQDAVTVPFEADTSGRMTEFWVRQAGAGLAFAGFRDVEIMHAVDIAGAPALWADPLPETPFAPALAGSLLQEVTWRPEQLAVRGGRATDEGLELATGGELWLHTPGMAGELRGRVERATAEGGSPHVLVVWYKGGRVQVIHDGWPQPGQPFDFRVWTAEPGGWIGVITEGVAAPPLRVRVTSANLTP